MITFQFGLLQFIVLKETFDKGIKLICKGIMTGQIYSDLQRRYVVTISLTYQTSVYRVS